MTQNKPQTIRALLPVAAKWLGEQGVDEARLDAELILAHVLETERMTLYMDHDRPLNPDELVRFRALMRRRGEGREPVAYLIGERAFYGIEVEVAPGVLIPRSDTELLVEEGLAELTRLAELRAEPTLRFVDVGTGSGCVAFALATARPDLRGVATDRSAEALAIAARNRARCELGERVALTQADLLGACARQSVDLVVSNPPYVLQSETHLLSPEILRYEPLSALYDEDDLPLTRRLAEEASQALRPGGALLVETGFDKAALVARYFEAAGFVEVRPVKDLGGIERVVVGRLPE